MDFSNNRIDTQRRTAVYVRISTSMQKTDRQVEELVTFAKENKLNFNEKKDIYRDVCREVLWDFYSVTPVLKMAISRQPFFSLLTGSPEATFRI